MTEIAPGGPGGLVAILWREQGGRCFHCGLPMTTGRGRCNDDDRWSREHLFPRRHYAVAVSACIVLAHRSCNCVRGDRHPSRDEIARARAVYTAAGLPWPAPVLLAVHVGCCRPLATIGDLWPEGPA